MKNVVPPSVKILFIFLLSFILFSCSNNKRRLYIYNWSGYIAPELIEKFEKLYNCEIVFDYFDSNEAMFAKLKVGRNSYDMIFPSSYMADIMYKQGMITEIDKSKIPNLKYIDKKYLDKMEDSSMKFSIPYAVSFTGVGYDGRKIKEIEHSWGVFGEKKYSHRMTMLNDMREAIGAALKYLGYSLNTTNDRELAQAKDLMLKWKRNLAAYQGDEAKVNLEAGILLVIQSYKGDIVQIAEMDSPNLKFFIPKEGTSIGIDTIVIPKNSKNKDLVYKFINFLFEPKNSLINIKYLYYIMPNKKAMSMLDGKFREKLTIPDDIFKKSEVIRDLGKDNIKYIELWDEIKAISVD